MKINLIIIFLSLFFLSCNQNKNQQLESKIEELESKLNNIESNVNNDEWEAYREDENPTTFVQDVNLNDLSIKNLIYEFGPLKFMKDNDKWFIITVGDYSDIYEGPEFQIYKMTLNEVHEKTFDWDTKYDRLLKGNNSYKIESTNSINLQNMLSVDYNRNYTSEVSVEDIIFHNATENYVKLSCNLLNTLKKDIKKISFKVKIFTSPVDGDLVSEDVISVNTEVGSNEMKTVKLYYEPEGNFKEKLYFFGYDVQILKYE